MSGSNQSTSGSQSPTRPSPDGCKDRWRISVIAPKHRGHFGVPMDLYHKDGLDDDLYRAILAPLDHKCSDLLDVADATFSPEEVEQLRAWFAAKLGGYEFLVSPAIQVFDACFKGECVQPIEGEQGTKDFRGAPVAIEGYYELSGANSGPFVEKRQAAYEQAARDAAFRRHPYVAWRESLGLPGGIMPISRLGICGRGLAS